MKLLALNWKNSDNLAGKGQSGLPKDKIHHRMGKLDLNSSPTSKLQKKDIIQNKLFQNHIVSQQFYLFSE